MDQQNVEALAAGASAMALGHIGDRLGLLRATADLGPSTSEEIVRDWLARVPGLTGRLSGGTAVADVRCGRGVSTVTMAKAFPSSRFLGIDDDPRSIDAARSLAAAQAVGNVDWVAAPADRLPRYARFALICAFERIHDMVDPRGTLRAIRDALAGDGVFLWAEPIASADPAARRHPVGTTTARVGPLRCMTVSPAPGAGRPGTPIGEWGVRALAAEAGFTGVERLPIDSPFNEFFALRR